VYVVWVKLRGGEVQNAGALSVNDDLEGKLETTTPHRAFTLMVTPEPSARVGTPTHKPVFTSEVNRTDRVSAALPRAHSGICMGPSAASESVAERTDAPAEAAE
jgi:hypothetical protein